MSVRYVEYLSGSGTQYINTGLIADDTTEALWDFEFVANYYFAGARYSASSRTFLVTGTSASSISIDNNTGRSTVNVMQGTRCRVEMKGGQKLCNDLIFDTYSGTFTTPGPQLLFGAYLGNNADPYQARPGKFYRATYWTAGMKVLDLCPALDENGVACMWDEVSQSYFYNAGTGTFIPGPEIKPPSPGAFDKKLFLSGLAVGRQLKGWGEARGSVGFYYVSNGAKTLVNRQGSEENNYVLLTQGVRYCTMHIEDGYMYVFAAAPDPFTMKAYSNDTEESGVFFGSLMIGELTYYYAYCYWYNPLPIPTVDSIKPVRISGERSISEDMCVTQGMLYLYGELLQRDFARPTLLNGEKNLADTGIHGTYYSDREPV